MAYDIVGGIHNHADTLYTPLAYLGYENSNGAYRYLAWTTISMGDFIDRGPQQLGSVMSGGRIVVGVSGQAVLGNHEFNAIARHTPNPTNEGEYLRPRGGTPARMTTT